MTDAGAGTVGSKAYELARLTRAGLPVPDGFVVPEMMCFSKDSQAIAELKIAFERIGQYRLAVRSSACDEDGANESFAGQHATVLGVQGWTELFKAIDDCGMSTYSERAKAYRKWKGLAEPTGSIPVIVQQLVPADVAGVAFTRDPNDASGERMVIEASYGLGEAVVSGRVTPDRFAVRFCDGVGIERHLGSKTVRIDATGESPVPPELQSQFCLNETQLAELAELGRKVEQFYGSPRDIEWAIADGKLYLLQARPITTTTAAEREGVRAEVIDRMRGQGDCWVKDNLSEILPEPTPLTWDILQRLFAQDGGFGLMNRDLGCDPDSSLGSQSAYDLIAGRPMLNLGRSLRMQFRHLPMEYPVDEYKADPRKALDPQPVLKPWKPGILRLPGTILRLMKMSSVPRKLIETFADKFMKEIAPAFATEAKAAIRQDWSKLDDKAVHDLLDMWINKTLVHFARESLKPTVLAKLAWDTLVQLLTPKLGVEKAKATVAELSRGANVPDDANLAFGLKQYAEGAMDEATYLERFGHRGRNEMELSAPRWSEALPKRNPHLPPGGGGRRVNEANRSGGGEFASGGLDSNQKKWLGHLHTYIGLREVGKHHLLMGYAVIRRALVELDSRLRLNGGIFFLTRKELAERITGKDFATVIGQRKKRRLIELSLEVPSVLFADDLDAIGRPVPPQAGASTFQGTPVSAGVAEGIALVLTEPVEPPDEPFVLVCPSTDPAWVPLFAKSKALVMENGGILSHGAIVAREFGLPAVAGVPGIMRQLRTGQRIRVDGTTGCISINE
jgi:pyruvate,water dikinase